MKNLLIVLTLLSGLNMAYAYNGTNVDISTGCNGGQSSWFMMCHINGWEQGSGIQNDQVDVQCHNLEPQCLSGRVLTEGPYAGTRICTEDGNLTNTKFPIQKK